MPPAGSSESAGFLCCPLLSIRFSSHPIPVRFATLVIRRRAERLSRDRAWRGVSHDRSLLRPTALAAFPVRRCHTGTTSPARFDASDATGVLMTKTEKNTPLGVHGAAVLRQWRRADDRCQTAGLLSV